MNCLDSAGKGKGTTVFVSGETGSGKTRFITEFLNTIKKKEMTILFGWCLSNTSLPYFPFIEAFSSNIMSIKGGSILSQPLGTKSWLSNSHPIEKTERNRRLGSG